MVNKAVNRIIIACGSVCAFFYVVIVWMSYGLPRQVCEIINTLSFNMFSTTILEMQNGFYYDTANNDMPTGPYLFCFFIIFFIVLYLIKKIRQSAYCASTLYWIVGFAIAFRLIVFSSVLIHENDIYRYMWDGHVALAKINPYKYAPADVFMYEKTLDFDFFDDIFDEELIYKDFDASQQAELHTLLRVKSENETTYHRIGHWQVPTIYPPVAQLMFMSSMALKSDSVHFMRFMFALFDIGCLFLIIGILKCLKMNPLMCVVYGWLPVVVIQLSLSGHYDAVVIFFVLAAIYLYLCRRPYLSCMTLALAVLSKFFPVVLFPFLYRKNWMKQGLLFLAVITVFYLPYIVWGKTGMAGVFEGFMTYNKEWSYNASIFDVVYYTLEWMSEDFVTTLVPSKIIVGLMYLGLMVFFWMRRAQFAVSDKAVVAMCFWLIAGLFIINPVADAWYYCWVIPFLCVFPYRSWIMLSGLLMLSYLNFHSDIAWIDTRFLNIKALQWVIYVPFYVLLGTELFKKKVAIE